MKSNTTTNDDDNDNNKDNDNSNLNNNYCNLKKETQGLISTVMHKIKAKLKLMLWIRELRGCG